MTFEDSMETPGERIKTRRIALGISQGAFARMVGMAQSTLSELERGDSRLPNADNLQRISKALGVTQAWIVTGKEGALEVLTTEEEKIFASLRRMPRDKREAIFALIDKFRSDD